MNRRAFLSIVASSPLVFGLRELLAQEPRTEAKSVPEWYRAALKRMKETNRYGIVIVVPDDPKERERWGKALIDRYNEIESRFHEPFGVVVLICLTSTLAEKLLEHDRKSAPARIDLRPDGRIAGKSELKIETLESSEKFGLAFSATDEQLKEQGPAIEKTLPESFLKSAEQLYKPGAWSAEATAVVLEKADAILPWIVWKCRWAESKAGFGECIGKPESNGLRRVLNQYWTQRSYIESDPCLPYGAKVEALPAEDPCPPCGMARISSGKARKFLSFYEK